MRFVLVFMSVVFLLFSCKEVEENSNSAFVPGVEKAHAKSSFLSHNAISFDLYLEFGGKKRYDGRITLLTNSTKGKLEQKNGSTLLFDENKVYQRKDSANTKGSRFGAYTWPYFFLFPYKLSDPGTIWSEFEERNLLESRFSTGKLTFAAGTGDAPQDWYIAYADPETYLLQYAAYIVTAGSSQEEAEKDPHAIAYSGYKLIDGVPIAHQWVFWEWREKEGLTKKLGRAKIRKVTFESLAIDFFEVGPEWEEIL